MLVAFAGYKETPRQERFTTSLKRWGIDSLYYTMYDWSWENRMEWQRQMALRFKDEVIIFTDATDFIFLGGKTPDDIESLVLELGPVSFPGQRECWPEPAFEARYPPSSTPWRFLNASGPAGRGKDIAEAIRLCQERYPMSKISGEPSWFDEWPWQQMHMDGLVNVDTNCRLTQCLYGTPAEELFFKDGILVNLKTGTAPVFIHGNGDSFNHPHHRRFENA